MVDPTKKLIPDDYGGSDVAGWLSQSRGDMTIVSKWHNMHYYPSIKVFIFNNQLEHCWIYQTRSKWQLKGLSHDTSNTSDKTLIIYQYSPW